MSYYCPVLMWLAVVGSRLLQQLRHGIFHLVCSHLSTTLGYHEFKHVRMSSSMEDEESVFVVAAPLVVFEEVAIMNVACCARRVFQKRLWLFYTNLKLKTTQVSQ